MSDEIKEITIDSKAIGYAAFFDHIPDTGIENAATSGASIMIIGN